MGSERETSTAQCPCKKGLIRIVVETPDHAYASRPSIDADIECPACEQNYRFHRRSGLDLHLVRAADLDHHQQDYNAWVAAGEAFLKLPQVAKLKLRIIGKAKATGKAAAEHRLLKQFGIADRTAETYRKNGDTPETLVGKARFESLARAGSDPEFGGSHTELFKGFAQQFDLMWRTYQDSDPEIILVGSPWLDPQ